MNLVTCSIKLRIKVLIPDIESLIKELHFKATRSGGKGGQNVNKVSTKVELHFSIWESVSLDDEQKARLALKLQNKLSEDGVLRVVSSEERTQLGNKKKALDKFRKLISSAFVERKKRVATKATKASKERRLREKKRTAEIKKLRKPGQD